MQNLTFLYLTQHIQLRRIENNTIVMCFLIYFQIGVLGTSRGHHFRTLLGLPWDVSTQFLSKWMNLIVFASWWYAESTSIQLGKLLRGSWDILQKCSKCKEL